MLKETRDGNNYGIISDDLLAFDPNGGLNYLYAISGSFTYPSGVTPCSILVNKGNVIAGSACHAWLDFPETVIYRLNNGKIGIRKVRYASELPNEVRWAVGGMGLLDNYKPSEEGFSRFWKNGKYYNYTDVLRKTNHTVLGIKDGYTIGYYLYNMSGSQVNAYCKAQGLTMAIMGDGGHIPAINTPNKKINISTRQGYGIQFIGTPEPTVKPNIKKKVAIDSGHSELTRGKFYKGFYEHEFNFDVSNILKDILEYHGVGVKLVQVKNADSRLELAERVQIIDDYKPDLCISIHADAFPENESVDGWGAFSYNLYGDGYKIAKLIEAESVPFLTTRNRGVKDGSHLYIIRATWSCPTVLIEHGFFTNTKKRELMLTTEYKRKCATADAKGILKYLGIDYKEKPVVTPPIVDTPPTEEPSKLYIVYKQEGAFGVKENAEGVLNEIVSDGGFGIIIERD